VAGQHVAAAQRALHPAPDDLPHLVADRVAEQVDLQPRDRELGRELAAHNRHRPLVL
jgi:hypothetical protein